MNKQYKKIFSGLIAFAPCLFSLTSCAGYLDVDKYFTDVLTLDSAFTKRTYAEGFLSNAFEVTKDEVQDISTGGKGGYALFASDDLLRMGNGDYCKKYQNGEYSAATTLLEDKWKRVYEPVRKSTVILNYIDRCMEMTASERIDVKGQAHFLRGLAYWTLLRQYGPLPLIPDAGFDISMSYDELSVQRNTYDECVDYIANEFVMAALQLPDTRTSNNIGRPTKGAALAARARLYLFAASPLNNGNKDLFNLKNYEGKQLISQTYDESKWARAAAAALDVINLKQYKLFTVPLSSTTVVPPNNVSYSDKDFPDGWADIDPFESYCQLFNGGVSASKNPELIFTRPNDDQNGIDELVNLLMPKTLSGENAIAVTQKQVDAYSMKNGYSITDSLGGYVKTGFSTGAGYDFIPANVSLQYANREPRFYASIAYSGSIWPCKSASDSKFRDQQIFYYKDLNDGKLYNNTANFPITGIGMKKYYNPEDSKTTGGYTVAKFEPAIRYAEILMIYAEALSELTTTYTVTTYTGVEYTIKRDVDQLRVGMKPIRIRAGLPDLSDNMYNDQDQFRSALKHERQIEFFAEQKRFYDLRRWKDAAVEENMPIKGCNVEMTNSDTQKQEFYTPTVVTSYPKIFLDAMSLCPIPYYELKKNKRLTQNPGW